jgi:hypothetical protein
MEQRQNLKQKIVARRQTEDFRIENEEHEGDPRKMTPKQLDKFTEDLFDSRF